MRSGLSGVLVAFGTILLAFGITIVIIELLAIRYGTPHDIAPVLAGICLVGGGILAGAGTMLNRAADKRTSSS